MNHQPSLTPAPRQELMLGTTVFLGANLIFSSEFLRGPFIPKSPEYDLGFNS